MKTLMFAMALAIFGGMVAGCGHKGNAGLSGKDSTKVDTTDTVKVDTTATDSVATADSTANK